MYSNLPESGHWYIDPTNEVNFLEYSENYCICFVDMINSTRIAAAIHEPIKLRKYYSIFLNSMAKIAKDFGAHIIKNAGDSMIFYFPDTSDSNSTDAFKQVLDCCLEMSRAHDIINSIMDFENLPSVSYRISADYGRVEIVKSKNSTENDLIGSTMNICAKINLKAKPNGIVIGGDLYEILQRHCFSEYCHYYHFEQIGEYSLGLKYSYPIFSVSTVGNNDSGRQDLLKSVNLNDCFWPQNRQKFKIMLIDDEPDVLVTYRQMLSNTGIFDVDAFPSSQEALKQLFSMGATYYNLIITDVRMPPPNGLQLYSLVKSVNKNIKILFVTAFDIVDEVLSMLPEVRPNEIIKKPTGHENLIRQVKMALA